MTNLAHATYSPYPTSFNQTIALGSSSSYSSNDDNTHFLYINAKYQELENCLSRLDKISNYENDWDNYGAIKPNSTAISNAKNLLKRIFCMTNDASMNWITPYISADSDGNISIEWWGANDKKITFYIGCQNHIDYIKSSNSKISEMEDGEIKDFTIAQYIDLFSWLSR